MIKWWQGSLLAGRAIALRAARAERGVALIVRLRRVPYWREIEPERLDNAGSLLRAVAEIDAYTATRDDPGAWDMRARVHVSVAVRRLMVLPTTKSFKKPTANP